MFRESKEKWLPLRTAAGALEVGLGLFPLLVVGLSTAMFPLGNGCAPWQLWMAMLSTMGALCFLPKRTWRARMWGVAGFLGFMGTVWLLAGCFVSNGADNSGYHLPVTRLLMLGWNPVLEATPERLAEVSGLPLEGMWYRHVLFIAHPVEVFNAVFGFFTRTPFDLTFPLTAFLLPLALGAVWRMERDLGWSPCARLASLSVIAGESLQMGQGIEGAVDIVVALAGIGLVASMTRFLHGNRCWAPLLLFSFWMMVAKQSSLLTCFIFWICFSVALLWRNRAAWRVWSLRLTACGALLTGALCWVCASPYLTAWKNYGHPLYPAYTADAVRFPTHDITGDFKDRNEDAQRIGHIGHLLNAYVSPALVRRWYAWRLEKPDFMPYCWVWRQGNRREAGFGAPTTLVDRTIFGGALLLLLAFGGRRVLSPILFCLAGLFCFPTQYIGYLRYVPWLALLPGMAAGALCAWLTQRKHMFSAVSTATLCCIAGLSKGAFYLCISIDYAWEAERFLDSPGIAALIPDAHMMANNLRLLCRQEARLRETRLLPPNTDALGSYRLTMPHFNVIPRQGALPSPSAYKTASTHPTRAQRYRAYLLFMPKTLFCTFPNLLWKRFRSLF